MEVEPLREFIRLNYVSLREVAWRIGLEDSCLSFWLSGERRPAKQERIITLPGEKLGHRPGRLRLSGIQEAARDSQAAAMSVLPDQSRVDGSAVSTGRTLYRISYT